MRPSNHVLGIIETVLFGAGHHKVPNDSKSNHNKGNDSESAETSGGCVGFPAALDASWGSVLIRRSEPSRRLFVFRSSSGFLSESFLDSITGSTKCSDSPESSTNFSQSRFRNVARKRVENPDLRLFSGLLVLFLLLLNLLFRRSGTSGICSKRWQVAGTTVDRRGTKGNQTAN